LRVERKIRRIATIEWKKDKRQKKGNRKRSRGVRGRNTLHKKDFNDKIRRESKRCEERKEKIK